MNRQQRRTAESQARRDGSTIGAQSPEQEQQAEADQVNRLLSGKEKPANEFLTYLVEQAKVATSGLNDLNQAVKQAEAQLASMRQNLLRQQGSASKYIDDIRAWLKRGKAAEAKTVEEVRREAKQDAVDSAE